MAEAAAKTNVLSMEIDLTCNSETEESSSISDHHSHSSQSLPSDSATRQERMNEEEPSKQQSMGEQTLPNVSV